MSDVERPHNIGVDVERTDVSPKLIALLAAGLALFVMIAMVAIRIGVPGALRGFGPTPRPTATPQLEADPAANYGAYRANQLQQLQSYRWIDRQRGVVRLPIEQGMHDVAASGIKDWPGAEP